MTRTRRPRSRWDWRDRYRGRRYWWVGGNGFCRGLREGGSLAWNESGVLFYDTDAVIDGLGGWIANQF